ncbi:MAG: AI-2E family transporter [Acidobacteria bacterium]|nr:AI-2E family transporter [Acidobacteriota bacterium]
MIDDRTNHEMNSDVPTTEIKVESERPVIVALDRSSISIAAIVRVVAVTLVLLFIGGFLASIITSLAYLFFLLVLSVFFAYLIDPLVKLIRRPFKARKIDRFMPRSLAIIIAYAIVFSVLGYGIWAVAPLVSQQGREFGASLPAYAANVRQAVNDLDRRFDRMRLSEDIQNRINEQVSAIGTSITAAFGTFLLGFAAYLPWLVLVPILAFFFLKDVNLIRLAVLRLFPVGPLRMRAGWILEDINSTLAAYTRAQLLSCLLIGTICTAGFYLIGLKYALLLGILAGVFEFVPLLGPAAIGLIVVTTSAFGDNPWRAVYSLIFLVALRVVHDYVTYPRIVRGGLHLHPVLIILSVLAGEQAAGIPGVFLAIPLVALGVVIYRHIVEHKGSKGLVADMIESTTKTNDETPPLVIKPGDPAPGL